MENQKSPRRHTGVHRHTKSRRFCFVYKDVDGRWKHKLTDSTERKPAKAERLKFLEELRQGKVPTDTAKWTVDRAAEAWLEYRKATAASRITLRKDRHILNAV